MCLSAVPVPLLTVLLVLLQEFLGWCERLFGYLQVLENRLFSEGLHVLGAAPSDAQMAQYLEVSAQMVHQSWCWGRCGAAKGLQMPQVVDITSTWMCPPVIHRWLNTWR